METNCYLLISEKLGKCIVIDPGDDAEYINRIIQEEDVVPIAIVATHGHFDHILAAMEVKLAYNVPFAMNSKDNFLLKRMKCTAENFNTTEVLDPPSIDLDLKDTDKIEFGNIMLSVISIPGHTPGSISVYVENHLFVGDLVFADGSVGRTDFKYANYLQLRESIDTIIRLPKDVRIYPGHGEITDISAISKFNAKQ